MSVGFDPVAAAEAYANLDTEELIRIAYLEREYLPEAKALALRELDKRGVPEDRNKLIRQVRAEIRERARALEIQTAERSQQWHALELRLTAAALIGFLWFAALLGPTIFTDANGSGVGVLLLGVWGIAAINAIMKARRKKYRQLYLVVLIPAVLFVVGMATRAVT